MKHSAAGNRINEQIDHGVTAATHNALNQITALSPTGPIRFEGTVSEPATVNVNGGPAYLDGSNTFSADVTLAPGTPTVPVVATDGSGNTATRHYQVTVDSGTSRTLTYDANGNLTNDGAGKAYDWDAADRLVKITQGGNVTEFVYNGVAQRVQEKLAGSVIKQWVWCDGLQPCEERDASNAVTRRFYAAGEQIGSSVYSFTTDHLGSVREMTDATGAIRARYDYDPYGRVTKVSGDLEADFGFTGFYRHQASGLSLTLYRAYDSNLGRWLSRDPIAEQGGINLYGYVYNNPLNLIDPLGLFTQEEADNIRNSATMGGLVGGAFFGAIGGGAGGFFVGLPTGPGEAVAVPAGAGLGALGGAIQGAVIGRTAAEVTIAIGNLIDSMAGTKAGFLPKGGSCPYNPKKQKSGELPRNKRGDYIDKNGNAWRWDPIKAEWDVQLRDGGHLNVGPDGEITH